MCRIVADISPAVLYQLWHIPPRLEDPFAGAFLPDESKPDSPFQPRIVPRSYRLTTLKTGCNIAGVGAILPFGVAVGREGFPAAGAGEGINGFLLYRFRVGVPPLLAAAGRAELYLFSTGSLLQLLSTVEADAASQVDTGIGFCNYAAKVIFAAKCLDAILDRPTAPAMVA